MNELRLETLDNRTAYRCGQSLDGIAAWQLDDETQAVEVRLLWHTQGKGDRDLQIVSVMRFDKPANTDAQTFHFDLPTEPYSFSGKLVSLVWTIELVILPSEQSTRMDIVVSPSGEEVDLTAEPPEPFAKTRSWWMSFSFNQRNATR